MPSAVLCQKTEKAISSPGTRSLSASTKRLRSQVRNHRDLRSSIDMYNNDVGKKKNKSYLYYSQTWSPRRRKDCSIKFPPTSAGIVRNRAAAPAASPADDSSGDAQDLKHLGFKFKRFVRDCDLRLHGRLVHEPANVLGEHEAQARRSPGTRCLDQEGKETCAAQLQGARPCREEGIGDPL
jgi:hypothetical protein